ncbi:MAG: hypothetical protein AB8B91_07005 [Rubripirellula sp.]
MFRHATIALTFFLVSISAPRQGIAQSVDPNATPTEMLQKHDVDKEQLLKKKYSSRQQATMEMWRGRDTTREEVQDAAQHPDPEVSGRAKWILRQWRRGSLPGTPPEVSRQLQSMDGPSAVARLLEGGHFAAAIVAVEESVGTVEREAIQNRITSALVQRFPIYVHHAMKGDSLTELLKLIDMVADTKELALCRIQLMQELGLEIDDGRLLPSSSQAWSKTNVERAKVLELTILGRHDEAIDIAKNSADAKLLQQCRMVAGRWDDAAKDNARLAREADAGSHEHARRWSMTLVAAERAGDAELATEAIAALTAPVEKFDEETAELAKQLAEETAKLRWKSLASHGQIELAFGILDKLSPHHSASVAIDASRTERAFDVLGFPLSRMDTDLTKWVAQAIDAERESKLNEPCAELRRVLALLQTLISVGRDDAAWSIAQQLSESDAKVDTLLVREYVLSTLTMTRRTDWMVKLAVMDGEKEISDASVHTIARTLNDADGLTLEIMIGALSRVMPGRTMKERLAAAVELLQGDLPEGFYPDSGFQRLYEHVTNLRPSRDLRRRTVQLKEILANDEFVHFFMNHGLPDLAAGCRQKMAETGDVSALFALADHQLDFGRTALAEQLFEGVYRRVVATRARSVKGATDTSLAVKSLIGLWSIARRSGDDERREELLREIRLSLCSPSARLRNTIAQYLVDREEALLAMEVYEVLLPMTVFGTKDQTSLYDVARSYSLLARKTDPKEAARWFDLAVVGTSDSISYRPGAYITLPLYVQRWSIEAAIKAGDRYLAQQSIERLLQLDPMDIDFAERLLPKMREAGMEDLADKALDRIVEKGTAYVQKFPFDAMTANNLAWVAAMNERHLKDARWLSETAVRAEPDSAIYRDTLAEVLFLQGEIKQALQVEQACLLDDPTQWHLHEQVSKYSKALGEG